MNDVVGCCRETKFIRLSQVLQKGTQKPQIVKQNEVDSQLKRAQDAYQLKGKLPVIKNINN